MTKFLDEVQLQMRAPSVFATGGASHTSERYGFIPTIEVVRGLKDNGFLPVMAAQSKCRDAAKKEHCRHIMRFRHESVQESEGAIPEIVLINSHDGSSSYQLRAGIYRLVCSNGLIVGHEQFCRRVKHSGNVIERVVDAANDLIEIVPESIRTISDWKNIKLTYDQAEVFAETAATLKWEQDKVPVKPSHLLTYRRSEDKQTDLWTTFNVIQENVIRGGIRYRNANHQRNRTREVASVNENVRLNTALWSLTEKMAQLVR